MDALVGPDSVRDAVRGMNAYVPGLTIDEICQRFGLSHVVKMASNENPLGTPPLVRERLCKRADRAFRYPQGGNPRLVAALAAHHTIDPQRVVCGNGSDELIDLCVRVRAVPGTHNVVCFAPCFSIYPLQSRLCGVEVRQAPLAPDFSFPFTQLHALVDHNTALVFLTTPDNPSGYCPPVDAVRDFARTLPPACLLIVDEAYMDFADDETSLSLLARGENPANVAFLRTFSKSYGLAGLRLGYGIFPPGLATALWKARLPFSVNILAEEAGLTALQDTVFRHETLRVIHEGRALLTKGLTALGCEVLPSQANFLMFLPPPKGPDATALFEELLGKGYIIRSLHSYHLPQWLRVSVGTHEENTGFLKACAEILA